MRHPWRHKLSLCLPLLAAGWLIGMPAAAAIVELRAWRQDGWVRVDLRASDLLDARTASTVESGLPGTCVYDLRLEDRAGLVVAERLLQTSLRFDLWEGRYLLEDAGGVRTLPTLAAADSAWSRLNGETVGRLDQLAPSSEYRLVARIVVRPLAAGDRERLSRYVSRHSGGGREQVNLDLGAVLSGIFGRRAPGERSVEFCTGWFRPRDLEERP